MFNSSDQLLLENVHADVIALLEILKSESNLNKQRFKLREIAERLEYVLITEG